MLHMRVKDKFQLTLPRKLRERKKIEIGDIFVEEDDGDEGVIRLRVKRLVNRDIAEGLADARAGRVHGPFDTAEEAIKSLRAGVRTRRTSRR